MNTLPQIRNENIVVQHLNDEVLIYFFDTNKAICLNSTSAVVFNHCNGRTTFGELKSKYRFTDDLIYFTLDKLNENNLLKEYQENSHFTGVSRRDVIKRIGLGSMVALPLITSVIAPTAAYAASGGLAANSTCTVGGPACGPGLGCFTTFDSNGNTQANRSCCTANNRTGPGQNDNFSTTGQAGCTNANCCDGGAQFVADGSGPNRGNCVC